MQLLLGQFLWLREQQSLDSRARRAYGRTVKFVLACLAVLAVGAVVAFTPGWVILGLLAIGVVGAVVNDRRARP